MKQIKAIVLSLILGLVYAKPALAVVISNPASGFLVSLRDNSFKGLLIAIINMLLSIAAMLAILFVIIGGFQYMTARGNDEQAESGRKTVTNAIIGLAIIILSYTIVNIVNNALAKY